MALAGYTGSAVSKLASNSEAIIKIHHIEKNITAFIQFTYIIYK